MPLMWGSVCYARLRVGQESCRTVTAGLRDVARRDPVMVIVHEKAVLSTALGSSYSPTSSTWSLLRLPTGASQHRAFKYKIISDSQSWVYWKWYRPQNVSNSTGEQYLREAVLEARHCMAMRHCSLGGKGWAGGLWELWDFVMKQHISNGMDVRQDFIQVARDNIKYSTIYLRRCCSVVLIFRSFCSILF